MNTNAQKIIPNLWFDDQAEEAAQFYTSLFDEASIEDVVRYTEAGREIHGKEAGKVMIVAFELAGYRMVALNGGPHFSFTPAISFFVVCDSKTEVNALWSQLSHGGETLMPLDAYPWSEKYGWVQDRYGLTWQLSLGDLDKVGQKITPFLLFVDEQHGRTEEALKTYTAIFDGSDVTGIRRWGEEGPEPEGTVQHAQFSLGGEMFMSMDSASDHPFTFNEAVSFIVPCRSQQEIDYYWEKLRENGDPAAQQCGWLKDRFGVSWQIVPAVLYEMMQDPDPERVARVTDAFMQMKKFDLQALQEAYESSERLAQEG